MIYKLTLQELETGTEVTKTLEANDLVEAITKCKVIAGFEMDSTPENIRILKVDEKA